MSAAEVVRLKRSVTDSDHVNGPDHAPVTLLEYGNFECVDCGRVFPVIKRVQKVLGNNVRFVFRHFPSVKTHPHAMRAAKAAEAAGAQGKFWQMHDELFTHQQSLEDQHLTRYAQRISLDIERFRSDLMADAFLKQLELEYQSALFDEHITGTPTLYINDIRYTGPTDLQGLLTAIKQADTTGQISLPMTGGIRRVLRSLKGHGAN